MRCGIATAERPVNQTSVLSAANVLGTPIVQDVQAFSTSCYLELLAVSRAQRHASCWDGFTQAPNHANLPPD